MTRSRNAILRAAAAAAIFVCAAPIALGQTKVDLGKREYDSRCAVCHGATGRGDGPYASLVTTRVADLSQLARRNGGVFPFVRVYESIDGSAGIAAHGPRDMPIWGAEYRVRAGEHYFEMPYDPEAFVRARILALTEYVYRLQGR
jgi:mono/diheme cytochrome c family protein